MPKPNTKITSQQEEDLTRLKELLADQHHIGDRCDGEDLGVKDIWDFIKESGLPKEIYQEAVKDTIKVLQEYSPQIKEMFGEVISRHYHSRCLAVADLLVKYIFEDYKKLEE